MGDTGLKNKVVIVTGANHGIGAGIALAFAKEGARVFINYYRAAAEAYGEISDDEASKAEQPGRAFYYKMQTQTADNVVQAIQELGSECFALEADLSIPETIPAIFDKAEKEFGAVDVLVMKQVNLLLNKRHRLRETAERPLILLRPWAPVQKVVSYVLRA